MLDLNSSRLKRTARTTHENTLFEERENTFEICQNLKNNGHTLLALEIAEGSIPLETLDYSKIEKPVLIIGNENHGIDANVLQLAHHIIHINMFGKNSSMNVAQATAISLFEITKRLHPIP